MNHACRFRGRRWAGLAFGEPFATLLGRVIVPRAQERAPFWRHNRSWNNILLSAIHLKEENAPHYLNALRSFGTVAIEGYPSAIFLLARFLKDSGERFPLRCVLASGEPLLSAEREIIEESFQTKVFDAYSQTERVVFASECEEHDGMHLFPEFGVCEIVNGDGVPVGPGVTGQIVGTSLHSYGMPVIRYAFGDVAKVSDGTCACGRTLPKLSGFMTREDDILVTPDGRLLPPMTVVWGFQVFRGLRRSQIVQHSRRELTVLLEMDDAIRPEDAAEYRRYIVRRFGPEVELTLERVDAVPLSPRGKYRRVISKVPLARRRGANHHPLRRAQIALDRGSRPGYT